MLLTDASSKLSITYTANLNDCFTITKLDSQRQEGSRGGHVGIEENQEELGIVYFPAETHPNFNTKHWAQPFLVGVGTA